MVQLLRLPNLVEDLVFNEMAPSEILLLSFCSKRVQKSIKQQFRIEPNKGFCIICSKKDHTIYQYQDIDEKRLELMVDPRWKDKKVINWKYVDRLDSFDQKVQILKEVNFLNDLNVKKMFDIELKSGFIFEINGLRSKYSISLDPKSGIPTLYFEKNMMKKWPMELHKYCVDLFRTTTDLEMTMNLDDSSDLHESQTIKNLYLHDSCERLDARIADEFFEKANIQNSLCSIDQHLEGFVSDDSKIWDIPNVLIYSVGWVHTRQLIRFTGKNAYFLTLEYPDHNTTQDMNAFLKHWLNSDNTNLEKMVVRSVCRSTEGLFDGIETSRWDPKRRPARYVSDETFSRRFCLWPDHLDCTNSFDIVREPGGLIASVRVEYGHFIMCVWHSKLL